MYDISYAQQKNIRYNYTSKLLEFNKTFIYPTEVDVQNLRAQETHGIDCFNENYIPPPENLTVYNKCQLKEREKFLEMKKRAQDLELLEEEEALNRDEREKIIQRQIRPRKPMKRKPVDEELIKRRKIDEAAKRSSAIKELSKNFHPQSEEISKEMEGKIMAAIQKIWLTYYQNKIRAASAAANSYVISD